MAKTDKVVKETVKRKRIIMLPEVKNYIIQPNRITNAVYNYTLIQEKIFTAIMFYLQEPISQSMKNVNIHQLDLFTRSEKVRLTIPLREIAKPRQYGEVKEAMQQMAGVVINIPYVDANEKKRKKITNLFNFDVPEQAEYQSSVIIEMEKMVAEILIDIDKDPTNQRPINYTRYIYEIAQNSRNKYTARLYKIISSWKKKGGFVIALNVLKEQLGVTDQYPNYYDFKRRVLLPAYEELLEKADCWFNCKGKDFEIRDGKTVTHLSFKVITPEFAEEDGKKTAYIERILRDNYKFTDADILSIEMVLKSPEIERQHIIKKIIEVSEYISENEIGNPKAYVIKSLLTQFDK